MEDVETLTEFGALWAEANAETSLLARVAVAGYDNGWPTGHVNTAIRVCNMQGAKTAGVERYEGEREAMDAVARGVWDEA